MELESDIREMSSTASQLTELKEVLDELYLDDAWTSWRRCPPAWSSAFWIISHPEMRKSINEMLKYPRTPPPP